MKPSLDSLPPQTADKYLTVCENLSSGDNVAEACRAAGVGERTFFRALAQDGDGPIAQAYALARKCRADKRASEIEDLARRATLPRDDPEYLEPNAARVAIDALKWLAGKENQTRYGDKLALDVPDARPSLSRADALAALQSGSIDLNGILDSWTKPVEAIEALPPTDSGQGTDLPTEV
jgi:hypothetical protein